MMEIDEIVATKMADLFRALGDTNRIRILSVLSEQEMSVGDLAERVDLTQSALSHQLRHLRQMRLVRTRKDGRFVFYLLDDDHIQDLFRCGLEHVLHG